MDSRRGHLWQPRGSPPHSTLLRGIRRNGAYVTGAEERLRQKTGWGGFGGRKVESYPFAPLVFHLMKLCSTKTGLFLSTITCTFSKTAFCALMTAVPQPCQEVLGPRCEGLFHFPVL